MPNAAALLHSRHGKARVRVAKVTRGRQHHVAEYTVSLELEGGTDSSFQKGDNRNVVSTDTCKNHVYLLAKTHPMDSPESFGVALAHRLLRTYAHVTRVLVSIEAAPWQRASFDGPHAHGFIGGGAVHGCSVDADRHACSVTSKLSFVQDAFTTLPETSERILATEIQAKWTYCDKADYADVFDRVQRVLLERLFGPSESGIFSRGVQETLYKMGWGVLENVSEVKHITLSLPNLHFLPCAIEVYRKNGIQFEDDVFVPCDEPHGIITATLGRAQARAKL